VLQILLAVLVAWTLVTGLRVRNPDAPVPELPALRVEGSLAFVTREKPQRRALYRYHAIRYALAPRPIHRETEPTARWVLGDLEEAPPGYVFVRRYGELTLFRRP
jgi:hypothetical protein